MVTVKANQLSRHREDRGQFANGHRFPVELVRQRWLVENQWHWVRNVQLGEGFHCYADCTGELLLSFLRTIAMYLLWLGGFRSTQYGPQKVANVVS